MLNPKGIFFRVITITIFFNFSTCFANPLLSNEQNDRWQFTIAPYVWALGMYGRVGVGNRIAHVDQTFSDVLQKLNFAGMLWLDLHHDRFGVFLNSLYAVMSDDASQGPYSVHDKNDYGLFSGGLSYQIYRSPFGSSSNHNGIFIIEPYAGFRYTENQVRLTFHLPGLSITTNDDQYWTDPIIGVRLTTLFHNGWEVNLSGDLGGLNASKQYSYNVIALLGYQIQSNCCMQTKLYLGYRMLDQRYLTGHGLTRFDWDMKLTGPLLGAAFSF